MQAEYFICLGLGLFELWERGRRQRNYLIMKFRQPEIISQRIFAIVPKSCNLQLTDHVSGRLSWVALVTSHLISQVI